MLRKAWSLNTERQKKILNRFHSFLTSQFEVFQRESFPVRNGQNGFHTVKVTHSFSVETQTIWAYKYLQTWETARGFFSFSQAVGVVSFPHVLSIYRKQYIHWGNRTFLYLPFLKFFESQLFHGQVWSMQVLRNYRDHHFSYLCKITKKRI